jgi:hypothetical protein
VAGVGRGFVAGVEGEGKNESFVREINVAKACTGLRRTAPRTLTQRNFAGEHVPGCIS